MGVLQYADGLRVVWLVWFGVADRVVWLAWFGVADRVVYEVRSGRCMERQNNQSKIFLI